MKRPVRVLQVLHIMNRGGAEAMIMNLYRMVDRTRVQFDFLVHSQDRGVFEDEITQMGGHIYRVQPFKGYNVLSYYNECKRFFKLHPEIKVVHGHLGSCAAYYLKAAKECGKFTIAHSHSADKIRSVYDFVYNVFSYPTRYVADQLFGCSTEAGIGRYGKRIVKSKKYKNFNNAIDIGKFRFNDENRKTLRSELGLSENLTIIGHVGRLTTAKNPHKIFSVFKYIVEHYDNIICLWVGTGEFEDEIKKMITACELQDKIIMTGVRSDIFRVMSVIDCMLFPSIFEGLPVSVVEAQAANLPTVLANTISKETQISDLLCWHSLEDDDATWAVDVVRLAKEHQGCRNEYLFNMGKTGYDINETVKWLMDFYEKNSN